MNYTKLMQALHGIGEFQECNKKVAAMIWLTLLMLFGLAVWVDALGYGLLMVAMAFPVFYTMWKYDRGLVERIAHEGKTLVLEVTVNGVCVGRITDADYATIQRRVFLDVRTYLGQLLNVGQVVPRMVNTWFVVIPLCLFWCGMSCFLIAPNTFTEATSVLLQATPNQIVSGARIVLEVIAISSILLVFVSLLMGNQYGVTNYFQRAVSEEIRHAIGCPVTGVIQVSPGTPGTLAHPQLAVCIGCDCDDFHACTDTADGQPCHWLRLDREAGLGVCSNCPEHLVDWDAGIRVPHAARKESAPAPASPNNQSEE